jgi:hypothetical protein
MFRLRLRVEFSAGGDQRGEVVGAADTCRQHRYAGNEPSQIGPTRQARCARACRELRCLFGRHSDRQLDAGGARSGSRQGRRPMRLGDICQPEITRDRIAHQCRNTDSLRPRTRHQRGFQAAHIDRDEVMGVGIHETTDGHKQEASEALVKLAAGRLSLHSPPHSVLARIKGVEPLDSALNPARHEAVGAPMMRSCEQRPARERAQLTRERAETEHGPCASDQAVGRDRCTSEPRPDQSAPNTKRSDEMRAWHQSTRPADERARPEPLKPRFDSYAPRATPSSPSVRRWPTLACTSAEALSTRPTTLTWLPLTK